MNHAVTMERHVSWFDPWEARRPYDEGPQPRLAHLQEDGEGRLWVVSWVADDGWHEALTTVTEGGQNFSVPESLSRYYDSVVEVIDPRRNIVIASARIDGLLMAISNGAALIAHDDAMGRVVLRVSRFSLPH